MFDFLEFIWNYEFAISADSRASMKVLSIIYFFIILGKIVVANVIKYQNKLNFILRINEGRASRLTNLSFTGSLVFRVLSSLIIASPFILFIILNEYAVTGHEAVGVPLAILGGWTIIHIVGQLVYVDGNKDYSWWGVEQEFLHQLHPLLTKEPSFIGRIVTENNVKKSYKSYQDGKATA